MKKCPVCAIEDDAVTIALHLLQRHQWADADAMDWLRAIEESRCA